MIQNQLEDWLRSVPHIELQQPEDWVSALCDQLENERSVEQLAADPYWPKWDSPWWKMLLLYELGASAHIPQESLQALCSSVERTYLTFFPLVEEELPKGIDPYRNIICHCALGCLYQMLHSANIDVDERFPWMRPWFMKYQLPDGGLNCDEGVYTRETPRSSFLSTLPCLEAILFTREDDELSDEERSFLDKGAQYLLQRELCYSISKGQLISKDWLRPIFPRYYFYDVLRGLRFISKWSAKCHREVPISAIERAVEGLLESRDGNGHIGLRTYPYGQEGTLQLTRPNSDGSENNWSWVDEAPVFTELDEISTSEKSAFLLTAQFREALMVLGP